MDYITTANVLLWFFLTLGFFLVFLSHWLVAVSLFPDFVADCASQYRRPVTVTLLGLLALVVPIAIGVAGLNILPPLLKWVGLLIIFAPILGGLMGTAGLAHKIGQGMPAPGDNNQPWKGVLRGGTALALTFLLPILGQILAIPLILASGLGASLLTWNTRRRNRPQATATAAAASMPPLPGNPQPAPHPSAATSAPSHAPAHIPALPILPHQLPS
ncbi:MAG: hypothetical protein JWL81_2224 [Verrucomicrobiales bacterium]|nr:hypothetical protein [Verrucomicrobiales bacterium]